MIRLLRVTTVNFTAFTLAIFSLAMALGNYAAAQRPTAFFNQPTTPTQLIALDQVQSELKLNGQQKKQIQEITDKVSRDVRALYRGLSREERRQKQTDLREKTAQLRKAAAGPINGLLSEAQRKRLAQIVLWVRGSAALADDDLAEQLLLTKAQQRQIAEVSQASRRTTLEAFRDLRDGNLRGDELRNRFAKLRRDADQRRLAVLDDDQKSAYLKLKGPKFELTRPTRARPPRVLTATQRRIQKRSYTFKEVGRDMEYALFVPSKYNAAAKFPLMVALHGLGSNPQQIMHYRGLTDLAEKHGYIVVAPMGYNERGWYGSRGPSSLRSNPKNLGELSEKDVMNVLALVRKEFNIADNHIYLMGHSMGGGGTWHLGIKYPDIWAGLAPIAPAIRGDTSKLEKIKHIPVIVVQGDNDRLVPVGGARRWVAKMKELGMEHLYIEVPGGDHVTVAFQNMPNIFEFFNKYSKKE